MFCGIDWAENHHDVAVVDDRGRLVAKRRISDDAAGLRLLLEVLTEHGDTADEPIPVAIETSRGLLVACLRATSRPVYAINPLAVSRYRERRTVARAKSDHADAMMLANILRTDAEVHRVSGRGLEPAAGRQPAAVAAARVFSRRAGCLPRHQGRAHQC
jgi:hypothetical protein